MKYRSSAKNKLSLLREDEAIYAARCKGTLRRKRKKYRLIDLFAGAGGMSLGFSELYGQAFKPIWANDFNRYCVDTYNANFGNHSHSGDIVELLERGEIDIPQADVVVGGPPCQGFSLLNKKREGDLRKQLWRPFLDVVQLSGADVFVMENVIQLLGSFEHGEIVGTAESLGFQVWQDKLCAADYGVPQTRWRAFIIGCRHTDPSLLFPPRRTHYNPKTNGVQTGLFSEDNSDYLPDCKPWLTVKDAISDLPPPKGTEIRGEPPPLDLHFGRNPTAMSLERYRAVPPGGNRFDLQKNLPGLTPKCWIKKKTGGTDLFGRLWWDRPAVTMRTEFYKPEKGRYLHPKQHRPITHREAARFQGFPDDFIFTGSKIEIARQIGNAVPPPLAARLADVVYVLLSKKGRRT